MKRLNVEGSWPALVTPFTANDKVNYEVLTRIINFHIKSQSDGILLLGSTAETILLSQKERKSIIDVAVDEANGRIPLLCGISSMTTKRTIDNGRYAYDAGVDGGLIVQPPYIKPTQKALYNYFKDVAGAVKLPLVIYNNPERCGVNVDPETVAKLSRDENYVAVKEAGPNPYGVIRMIELTKGQFNVLCCDCAFYALIPVVMSLGGKGTSNVSGNLCPEEFAELSKPWETYGDVLTTRNHLLKLLPLIRMMYSESNPVPLKAALNMIGVDVGKPRKPLLELSEKNMLTLKQVLDKLGILSEDSYQRSFFSKR